MAAVARVMDLLWCYGFPVKLRRPVRSGPTQNAGYFLVKKKGKPKRWIFLSEKKGNPKRWIFLSEKKRENQNAGYF